MITTQRHSIWMMGLLGLTTLMACSTDDRDESQPEEPGLPVELSASALPYEDETLVLGGTRSWTPPDGFCVYDKLYTSAYFESLNNKSIDVYLCPTGTFESKDPQHGSLRYSHSASSTAQWKLSLKNKEVKPEEITTTFGTNYYVYGFMPRDAADNASITMRDGSSTYADGAVLTIKGLQSVAADASVIIGAKTGPSDENDGGLRQGDFGIELKTGSNKTYLYMLLDHLCPALYVSMKVDGDYAKLRTIKLKRLYLQTVTDDGPTKKKHDVTVTLKSNLDGSDPIESIVFTPVGTEESGGTMFSSSEGVPLPVLAYSVFIGHFIPLDVTKLILTSTYDVYDKNVTTEHPEGNLVRKNCEATNTLDLKKLIGHFEGVRRDYRYNIQLTVNPTYLYMLSDPDLDNPTVELETV